MLSPHKILCLVIELNNAVTKKCCLAVGFRADRHRYPAPPNRSIHRSITLDLPLFPFVGWGTVRDVAGF